MWKESCKLKDIQIADLEHNLSSAHAMLDDARSEMRELQRRCHDGDHKLTALLATEKLARDELQGQVKGARAEVKCCVLGIWLWICDACITCVCYSACLYQYQV